MADFASPGVGTREVQSAPTTIRGAATSVAAAVFRSPRGVANTGVRITSFARFQRIFGPPDPNSYISEQVEGFFLNGGSEFVAVRVLGTSAGGSANTKASCVLASAAPTTVMTLTMRGEGVDGNSFSALAASENTVFGLILATTLTAGSQATAVLTAAGVAKVRVGDTLKFADGAVVARGIVSQIIGNSIKFENAVTVGVGGLTNTTTVVTLETFSLTLYYGATVVHGPVKNLRMSPLSDRDYFVTRINTLDDENYYTIADALLAIGASLDNRPVTSAAQSFTSGDEFTTYSDSTYIGSSGSATGLYALEAFDDIRMVAVPGVYGTNGAVKKALVDYCNAREDCEAATSLPYGTAVSAAVTYMATNIGASSFAECGYPWLKITDRISGQPTYTPPDMFKMGIAARTDRTRGVHKVAAGETDGRFVGTIGVERVLTKADRDTLYPAGINPIEDIPGVGQCNMGSRTLGIDQFSQRNVRRTFIYLRESLQAGTRWVVFENNTAETRAKLRRQAEAFLEAEWGKGTLEGITRDLAFTVTCDETNNPEVVIAQGKMVLDVQVRIPRTTEFLDIGISQKLASAA